MSYDYKTDKLRWGFMRKIWLHIRNLLKLQSLLHVGNKSATELHTVTRLKNPHSGQLDESLFQSHMYISFPKANETYHKMFHSTSRTANFLPDMKKMCSPQIQFGLSLSSESRRSVFNHTQNQGRPQRKATDKKSFI